MIVTTFKEELPKRFFTIFETAFVSNVLPMLLVVARSACISIENKGYGRNKNGSLIQHEDH